MHCKYLYFAREEDCNADVRVIETLTLVLKRRFLLVSSLPVPRGSGPGDESGIYEGF